MSEKAIEFELEAAEETWKRIAHVTISSAHMDVIREKVVGDLRKQVKRPGFRKGKVPPKIIRSEYAAEVERESLERVVPEAYREILKAHEELEPLGEPRVDKLSLEEGQPVGFDLQIEVRPEIELQGLQSCEVQRVEIEIGEKRVDAAMQELAGRSAIWSPVQREARAGDALMIDYAPLSEDGTPNESERTKDYAMELGGTSVLPEFNAALTGLQMGEDTQVEVSYPADYPREDLAGKTMSFEVRVNEIKEKQVPQLNDDFAQSASAYQTLEELRDAVRDDLVKTAQRESKRHFRESLVDEVLKLNAVAVPPSLEARYVQAMIEDLKDSSGRDFDAETRKKLAESYAPSARRATQRWLLIDHIKKTQGIDVGDEELQVKIEELAAERDATPEQVRQALQTRNGLAHLRLELEEDRVFDWFSEQVQVKVVQKSADELDEGDLAEEAAQEAKAGDESAQ
jgi:trigger factor